MAKSDTKRRRPFYELFVKMALILLIPLLLIFGCFAYALEKVVLKDYDKMNTLLIDSISSGIDSSITSQVNLAYSLRSLTALKQLSANLLVGAVESQSAYQELRNILSASLFHDLDKLTETVAIYFPDLDRVVSTDGSSTNAVDFYSRYISYVGLSCEEFLATVKGTKNHAFLPVAPAEPLFKAHRCILTYIQPISQGYRMPRAYFLAVITEKALVERVQGSFESRVQFQLFDESGAELYRSSGVCNRWLSDPKADSVFDRTSGTYRVFRPDSLSCGLRLVFYVPESDVLRSVNRFVRIFIVATVACVCLGLLLVNRLSWQLYAPFHKLLTTSFPEGLSRESHSLLEGFEMITDRVLETQQMNSRFQEELQTYFSASRDNTLLNLMIRSAYLSDEELAEAAELCKLPVESCSYQVALFKSTSADFELPRASSSPDEGTVLLVARLSARQFVAIAALSSQEVPSPLDSLARQYADSFRIGLSRVHAGIRDLSLCIGEADAACQKTRTPAVHYPIERELQIIAATRDGLYPEVSRLLNGVLEENLPAAGSDQHVLSELYDSFCVTALKAIEQLPEELRAQLESDARQLRESELPGDARLREILAFYERLCGATSNDIHLKNQTVIANVLEYLNEHYADPTLCLDSVAEHLEVSYYFLSRIFKSETNQSFSDLLNDTRVRRAAELLRTTQIPVQEVCTQVGYTNWSTFLRAFRKRAGTTPLQYRNQFRA